MADRAKEDQDSTAKTFAGDAEPPLPTGLEPGIVGIRRVITRPMTRADRVRIAAAAAGTTEQPENAPKPIPMNDYRPKFVQIKQKHKRPGEEPKPCYMSDIKV